MGDGRYRTGKCDCTSQEKEGQWLLKTILIYFPYVRERQKYNNIRMNKEKLIAKTFQGLENILAQELRLLGAEDV